MVKLFRKDEDSDDDEPLPDLMPIPGASPPSSYASANSGSNNVQNEPGKGSSDPAPEAKAKLNKSVVKMSLADVVQAIAENEDPDPEHVATLVSSAFGTKACIGSTMPGYRTLYKISRSTDEISVTHRKAQTVMRKVKVAWKKEVAKNYERVGQMLDHKAGNLFQSGLRQICCLMPS